MYENTHTHTLTVQYDDDDDDRHRAFVELEPYVFLLGDLMFWPK